MPRQITPATSLENLRREARRWLKALHARDAEARARLERALPDAPAVPTLRDVQHALAREFALAGWTTLRERLATSPPDKGAPDELVLRFLDNACPDHHVRGTMDHVRAQATAMRLLERYHEIADASFYTQVVCGDLAAVRRALGERPELARLKTAEPGDIRSGGGGSFDLYHDLGPKGWEPLLYLCFTRLPLQSVTDNAVAIAELLLDHGADPSVHFMAGGSRYTPLVGAIGEGEENRPGHQRRNELARLLLERGADPYDNQVLYNIGFRLDELWFLELSYEISVQHGRKADWDDPEWTMLNMGPYGTGARWHLEHAIGEGNVKLAEWCLAHGANPNSAPASDLRFSQLSLYELAVREGYRAIAELLAQYGAQRSDVTLAPMESFVQTCLRLDRDEIRRQVAEHPEYLRAPEPMLAAAGADRVDVLEFLLELGVSPDVENAEKERPLHMAAYSNAVRAARLLIERGAEVDPVESNYRNTPLGAAAYYQHRAVMDLLAQHSRDVWELTCAGYVDRLREVLRDEPERARSVWGDQTLLMWLPPADEALALDVAELLLAHGADAALRDKHGMTAADYAERNGMYLVAATLRTSRSAAGINSPAG